jgi:hypothetical protein
VEEVPASNEGRCATCGKGEAVLIKGRDSGFVRCAFRNPWEWISGRMPCLFNPARWVKDERTPF